MPRTKMLVEGLEDRRMLAWTFDFVFPNGGVTLDPGAGPNGETVVRAMPGTHLVDVIATTDDPQTNTGFQLNFQNVDGGAGADDPGIRLHGYGNPPAQYPVEVESDLDTDLEQNIVSYANFNAQMFNANDSLTLGSFMMDLTAPLGTSFNLTLDSQRGDAFDTGFDNGAPLNFAPADAYIVQVANNDALGTPDTLNALEDTPFTFSVNDLIANDVNTTGVASFTQPDVGSIAPAIVPQDGMLTFTPPQDFNGTATFTYIPTGTGNPGGPTTVEIQVGPVNDAPVGVADMATTVGGGAVTIPVLGNDTDVDGDMLMVDAVVQPADGSVTLNMDGTLTYNAPAGFTGMVNFSYSVSDGQAVVAGVPVTVDVVANQAPVPAPDAANVDEDMSVTILNSALLANDTDPEGDTLSVTGVGQGANGMVTSTANDVTYTPNPNFFGADTFSYTVSDGNGNAVQSTVDVVVNPIDDAPIATDDTAMTTEGNPVTINVLNNDMELDNEPLTVTGISVNPANGSVILNADQTVTYTPNAGFSGNDSFQYSLSDGNSTIAATVTVTVTDVDQPPMLVDDAEATPEDTAITINVLGNDTDDGPLTVVSATDPANGTVVVNADNTITYTPDSNFVGMDPFTYTASDGTNPNATAAVVVTVTPVNDAPVAVDDNATTPEMTAVVVDVLTNDSDVDGDVLSVVTVGAASNGVAVQIGNSIEYTPNAGFVGQDTISYTISDGTLQATATLTVDVTDVNFAPVAADDTATTDENVSVLVDVLQNDTDPDGDALTISVTGATQGTAVVENGQIRFTPAAGFSGPATVTYTVSDGQLTSNQATVNITVNDLNDPPNAVDDSLQVPSNNSVNTLDVLANDTDPENDTLIITQVNGGMGTVAIAADQMSIEYTPTVGFQGNDTITYTISDQNGGTATATVQILVTPSNCTPGDFCYFRDGNDLVFLATDSRNYLRIMPLDFTLDRLVVRTDDPVYGTSQALPLGPGGTFRVMAMGENDYVVFSHNLPAGIKAEVDGGTGNDIIVGTPGNDILNGGFGNDRILAVGGDNTLTGADGNDTLIGDDGADILDAGSGNDTLIGLEGNDILLGGAGNDNLIGGDGSDQLFGGEDDDDLTGGRYDDLLYGGSGSDTLRGQDGNDILIGGADNDALQGGRDQDAMIGGNTSADQATLAQALADWSAAGDILARRAAVEANLGISNDGAQDGLLGGSESDWFIFDSDYVFDFSSSSDIF